MMSINKKGGVTLWVVLVVMALAIIGAVVIYFMVTGDSGSVFGGSGNIPSPPALPN